MADATNATATAEAPAEGAGTSPPSQPTSAAQAASTASIDNAISATPSTTPGDALKAAMEAPDSKPLELKLPEGFVPEPGLLEEFKQLATEAKLDASVAQKLVDFEARRQRQAIEEFQRQDREWRAAIDSDPDVGGPKFAESLQHVRRAVDMLGGREVAELLASRGLGNHPLLFKGLVKLGRALAEDSVAGATSPADEAPRSIAEVFYPNTKFYVNSKES
jgi:hypothetical protein